MLSELYPYLNHLFFEDSKEGGTIFFFLFVFGNLLVCLFSTLMCFIFKKINLLYTLFGFLLGGSLIATFVNLIGLLPNLLFQANARTTFYLGLILTIVSYGIIAIKFKSLNRIGKRQ